MTGVAALMTLGLVMFVVGLVFAAKERNKVKR
jgi:hypothetical protein